MKSKYSISLENIIKEFQLEQIYLPADAREIMVSSTEVDRPGLALAGFVELFDPLQRQFARQYNSLRAGIGKEIGRSRIHDVGLRAYMQR